MGTNTFSGNAACYGNVVGRRASSNNPTLNEKPGTLIGYAKYSTSNCSTFPVEITLPSSTVVWGCDIPSFLLFDSPNKQMRIDDLSLEKLKKSPSIIEIAPPPDTSPKSVGVNYGNMNSVFQNRSMSAKITARIVPMEEKRPSKKGAEPQKTQQADEPQSPQDAAEREKYREQDEEYNRERQADLKDLKDDMEKNQFEGGDNADKDLQSDRDQVESILNEKLAEATTPQEMDDVFTDANNGSYDDVKADAEKMMREYAGSYPKETLDFLKNKGKNAKTEQERREAGATIEAFGYAAVKR